MDRVVKSNQAYYETPWRSQLQRIFFFMVVLILLGLIAGIYLSVNAEAATIGRHIQNKRIQINVLENQIADYQSQLAIITSAAEMEKRAINTGFRFANSDEITYMVVEGYSKPSHAVLASETEMFIKSKPPSLSPEYSQTIWDLVQEKISLPDMLTK